MKRWSIVICLLLLVCGMSGCRMDEDPDGLPAPVPDYRLPFLGTFAFTNHSYGYVMANQSSWDTTYSFVAQVTVRDSAQIYLPLTATNSMIANLMSDGEMKDPLESFTRNFNGRYIGYDSINFNTYDGNHLSYYSINEVTARRIN